MFHQYTLTLRQSQGNQKTFRHKLGVPSGGQVCAKAQKTGWQKQRVCRHVNRIGFVSASFGNLGQNVGVSWGCTRWFWARRQRQPKCWDCEPPGGGCCHAGAQGATATATKCGCSHQGAIAALAPMGGGGCQTLGRLATSPEPRDYCTFGTNARLSLN